MDGIQDANGGCDWVICVDAVLPVVLRPPVGFGRWHVSQLRHQGRGLKANAVHGRVRGSISSAGFLDCVCAAVFGRPAYHKSPRCPAGDPDNIRLRPRISGPDVHVRPGVVCDVFVDSPQAARGDGGLGGDALCDYDDDPGQLAFRPAGRGLADVYDVGRVLLDADVRTIAAVNCLGDVVLRDNRAGHQFQDNSGPLRSFFPAGRLSRPAPVHSIGLGAGGAGRDDQRRF